MITVPARQLAGRGRVRGAAGRVAASLALVAALLALVMPVTVAGVFRSLRPSWALSLAPWDSRAQAYTAQRLLTGEPGTVSAAVVTEAARKAFKRDGLTVNAVAALALAAALTGDEARATRLFSHVERLSRREPEAQLWLIEQDVKRNDIVGALHHYDVVLRTTPRLSPTLYPILIAAASERGIARELNRLLATRPPWSREFLTHFAYRAEDAQALVVVSKGLLDTEADRDVLMLALGRLVALGRYDLGWSMYADLAGRERASALVRNGGFADLDGLPPFDWEYARDVNLAPERLPRPGGGFALSLPAVVGAGGRSARQLLRLAPGPYELRAQVGDVPQNPLRRPLVKMMCATPETILAEADFPASQAGGGTWMALRFAVPSGCPHQWLSLWVRGDSEEGGAGAASWITSVSLRRL